MCGHAIGAPGPDDPLLKNDEPDGASGCRAGQDQHCAPGESPLGRRCGTTDEKTGGKSGEINSRCQAGDGQHACDRGPSTIEYVITRASTGAADRRPAHQIMPAQIGAERESQRAEAGQDAAPPRPAAKLWFSSRQVETSSLNSSV